MQIKAIQVDGISNGWDVIEYEIQKVSQTREVEKTRTVERIRQIPKTREVTVIRGVEHTRYIEVEREVRKTRNVTNEAGETIEEVYIEKELVTEPELYMVDTEVTEEEEYTVPEKYTEEATAMEDEEYFVDKEVVRAKQRMFCSEAKNTAEAAIAMFNEVRNPAPIDPAVLKAVQEAEALSQRQQQAWQLKQSILAEPVEFETALFRYASDDKLSIMDTLQEAALLDMPDTESMQWRLVEGIRLTTLADLKEVVRLGALRRRNVETSYTIWKQTDMATVFNYS